MYSAGKYVVQGASGLIDWELRLYPTPAGFGLVSFGCGASSWVSRLTVYVERAAGYCLERCGTSATSYSALSVLGEESFARVCLECYRVVTPHVKLRLWSTCLEVRIYASIPHFFI